MLETVSPQRWLAWSWFSGIISLEIYYYFFFFVSLHELITSGSQLVYEGQVP